MVNTYLDTKLWAKRSSFPVGIVRGLIIVGAVILSPGSGLLTSAAVHGLLSCGKLSLQHIDVGHASIGRLDSGC